MILYPKSHFGAPQMPRGRHAGFQLVNFIEKETEKSLPSLKFDGSRLTQLSQFPGFFFRYFRKKERNG
jgi:hypothetical protein